MVQKTSADKSLRQSKERVKQKPAELDFPKKAGFIERISITRDLNAEASPISSQE